MKVKLIFVSGLSGSGKTTLIRYLLNNRSDVAYLKTYTTRAPREDEVDSPEYVFVTLEEYAELRQKSQAWDHTEYLGVNYGADIADVLSSLQNGLNIICAVAPDMTVLQSMEAIYGTRPITVWIATPPVVAQARIKDDASRAKRVENTEVNENFDYHFVPTGKLEKDCSNFEKLISKIISL